MECAKKRSHDPVFRCLIGWACAQNLCHSRQKVAICPPCPNSNLQPHPWRVVNLRCYFWQRRCLRPDKVDIDAVGRIAAEINGIAQQDCAACAQRSRTETAYILITDDVHFFGGKQIMRAILGIDLVMVAHDPFAQWTVLNQIALQDTEV